MPKPLPLSLLADKCSSMAQIKQLHAKLIVSSRSRHNFIASRIINFCALSTSGDLDHALKLFHHTPNPNSFIWNTIIRALASSPNPSHAILLYVRMRKSGVLPSKHTLSFVLRGCSNCCSVLLGKQIHTHVLKFGLEVDCYVGSGLIRCYSVCGNVGDAQKVFEGIPDRNLTVWTTMVSGYAQNFCSGEALVLFDQMVSEGVEPNGPTLASVLSACARSGRLDLGRRIDSFIKEKGIEAGLILNTALVDMYAKNGAISMAKKLFDEMPERNEVTWDAMICGLANHGHGEEALELFWKMRRENLVPTDITLVGVLSACCHAGLVELGCEIFQSMKREYDIEPKIEHYGCMVDILGRAGRLLEAEELLKGVVWKVDVEILGALLAACNNHGNIEIAERVVDKMLKLEPHNHGVYVVLSNMYAEAGRWEDVMRLRKIMKDGDLNKIHGWSSVDSARKH